MKIGIFGGTFNPPHLGHRFLLSKVQKRLKLNKVLVIPSNLPPHKSVADNSPEHRMNMAKLAFPEYTVTDMEITRGGKSYTYLTLEELTKQYGGDKLYFICGSDMFLSFETWMKPQRIFELATVVTAARDKNEYFALLKKKFLFKRKYNAKCRVIYIKPFPVSSSQLRDMVKVGENISRYTEEKVINYIEENRLYK